MKKIIPIILFLIPGSSLWACECVDNISVGQTYATSDFVGTVKVVSVNENIAEIKLLKSYKGNAPRKIEFTPALESGILGGAMCEISIKRNQEWLLAISQNKIGKYRINSCSFAVKLQNQNGNRVKSQRVEYLTYFELLEAKVPNLNSEYNFFERKNKISDYLDKYDGQTFGEKSAHYVITLNQELKVDEVKVLKGFSDRFNRSLIAFLKEKTSWQTIGEQPIDFKETLYILDIYYYEKGKNFLSTHRL